MSEKDISEKTLEVMDKSAENFKNGKVSELIDEKLDKAIKSEELEDDSEEEKESEKEDVQPGVPVDDEKRSGVKEVVNNSDVMAIEEKKASEGVKKEENDVLPSFFVEEEDRHKVEIDVLTSKDSGQIVSISRKGLDIDFKKDFDYLTYTEISFEFSIPTYDEISSYRQRSATFRSEAQQMIVDRVQLRNFFLVWHLKDWSLKDRKGNIVKLEHDDDGSLSDASMKKVYSLQPTLVDIVMTLFEKDILLT